MITDKYSSKEINILLMDADQRYVRTIRQQLEKRIGKRFRLAHAYTLEEGLTKLSVMGFDIALISVNLTHTSSRRALIKVQREYPILPIVMLVRNKDKASIARFIHSGAQDCLFRNELNTDSLWRTIFNAIECKNIQLHLVEREALKAKFLESSLDGIISMDESGSVVEFNRAAEEIFGYKRDEIIGQNLAEKIIPPKFRLAHERGLKHYLKTGEGPILSKRSEMTALRFDGQEFPVEISVVPMKANNRHFFTSFIRDLTEKKRVERDLKAAKDSADIANQAKSNFLANMSHEIRTPLGVILGFTELLLDPSIGEDNKKIYGETIKRSGEMLSHLIDDILDFAKIESGKLQIEFKVISLREILEDIKEIADHLAYKKGIKFSLELDPKLPRYIVTDPLRLKQILINIVGNAIKFTSQGGAHLRVNLAGTKGTQKVIEFEVEDTGLGIDPGQALKLFTIFSQLDMSAAKRFPGTGLGLVLSKNLAALLGGDVKMLRSEPGKGSVFTVTITSDDQMALQGRADIREKFQPSSTKNRDIRIDGARILLAEDSPDNQMLFSSLLRMSGARVDVVSNGREALNLADKNEYDVVLMDIQMPEIDGYQACNTLRTRGYKKPVIALTAHALSEEVKKCEVNGFSDHLSKPVGRMALIEKIRQYLPRRQDLHHESLSI